jgi:transcriptional regulator with XRE-family HTH domain
MICKDPDLKFKTVMRQLRKDRGKTQIEVAKDLKIDPAKYRRMENISSGQSVTLKECADIMQYYNVESGMREIMVFLSKEDREKIIGRVKKTCDFLESILSGDITVRQLRADANDLANRYQQTKENLNL